MNRQNYIDAVVKVISNRGIRNSTLAIFELTSLKNFGIDVSTNMKLVEDYRNHPLNKMDGRYQHLNKK